MKNKFEVIGETTIIFLKRRNGDVLSAYIDTEDLKKIQEVDWSWYANFHKNSGTYYVMANAKKPDGSSTLVGLHRFLMDQPSGLVVDHIDRNPLNNKKSNLRIVTAAQNNQNTRIQKNNRSGARGVYWCKQRNVWRAYVKVKGRYHYFGNHKNLQDAEAAARDGRKILLPYANN